MSPQAADSELKSGGGVSQHALTARHIAELVGGELIGDGEAVVDHVASLGRATDRSVTFVASSKYAAALSSSPASVVLMTPEFREWRSDCLARVVVAKPQEALLQLLPLLHPRVPREPGIDSTVRIGRGARIGSGVFLGPYVVIGQNAVVGDRTQLEAHVVIGDGVRIGADCHLFPSVVVYAGSSLGDRVTLHAGARIGSDGFGYVFSQGAHQKIPHVGRCIIEDDVEIGANSTIDRGSIDDTVIGAGTKIDNLVQIAHNVRVGKLCLLMSQVGVAGSTHVGDGVILAGQVGVAGHVSIGAGARVGAQGGVISDIPAGETWSGYPARPHRQALRTQAVLHKLTTMFSKVEKLLKDNG